MKHILILFILLPGCLQAQQMPNDSIEIILGQSKLKALLPAINRQTSLIFRDSNSMLSIRIDRLPLIGTTEATPQEKHSPKTRKYINEFGIGLMTLSGRNQTLLSRETIYNDTGYTLVNIAIREVKPGIQLSLSLTQTSRQISEKWNLQTATQFRFAHQTSEGYFEADVVKDKNDTTLWFNMDDNSLFKLNRNIYQLCIPIGLSYQIGSKWSVGFGVNTCLSLTKLKIKRKTESDYNILEKRINANNTYKYPWLQLQPYLKLVRNKVSLHWSYDIVTSGFGNSDLWVKKRHFTTVGISYRLF